MVPIGHCKPPPRLEDIKGSTEKDVSYEIMRSFKYLQIKNEILNQGFESSENFRLSGSSSYSSDHLVLQITEVLISVIQLGDCKKKPLCME